MIVKINWAGARDNVTAIICYEGEWYVVPESAINKASGPYVYEIDDSEIREDRLLNQSASQ